MPSKAPSARNINFKALAKEYEISGGYIKNVALRAAFLAAARACRSTWACSAAPRRWSWRTWAAWCRAPAARTWPASPTSSVGPEAKIKAGKDFVEG